MCIRDSNWNTRISSFSLTTCPSDLPAIQITNAPPFDFGGNLVGNVSNVNPADYQVGVLLFVPGLGWYSKPYCEPLFTTINSDGTWSANVDTGGVDYTATKYAAYLVPLNLSLIHISIVRRHRVVCKEAPDHLSQPFPLFRNRLVPPALQFRCV